PAPAWLSRIGVPRRHRAGKPWRSGAKAGAVVPLRRRGPSPAGRSVVQLAVRGARAHPRGGPPAPGLQPHLLLRPPGARLHAAEGRGADGPLRVRGPPGRPPDASNGHRRDHGRADPAGERSAEPIPEAMGTVGEQERVAVVGAGSWGTAFGSITAEKGMDTVLWARREELAEAIASRHENPDYLPGIELPPALTATHDLERAMSGADVVVM